MRFHGISHGKKCGFMRHSWRIPWDFPWDEIDSFGSHGISHQIPWDPIFARGYPIQISLGHGVRYPEGYMGRPMGILMVSYISSHRPFREWNLLFDIPWVPWEVPYDIPSIPWEVPWDIPWEHWGPKSIPHKICLDFLGSPMRRYVP